MNFIKKYLGRKEGSINSYSDFWNWFQENEKTFFNVVKNRKNIEEDFFDKMSSKLERIKDGLFYLTGMDNDHTAELILTAEGNPKNIYFVEELVKCTPIINGWKFTALKPALDIKDVSIEMAGYKFNENNISFYSNDTLEYPDEVDIIVIHNDLNEGNKDQILNGTLIFLDNFLGELECLNNIDDLKIIGPKEANKKFIPIAKLKDYLIWRQKEFIEKYEGVCYDTENDPYSILEAKLENGHTLLATVNNKLLGWDSKASHPWLCMLILNYDGSKNNGMPTKDDYNLLNAIEEEIMTQLKDKDGYLNICRQTADGERLIYFACKDFRMPSKVFFNISKQYSSKFEIDYEIFKDKYWQSLNRFM